MVGLWLLGFELEVEFIRPAVWNCYDEIRCRDGCVFGWYRISQIDAHRFVVGFSGFAVPEHGLGNFDFVFAWAGTDFTFVLGPSHSHLELTLRIGISDSVVVGSFGDKRYGCIFNWTAIEGNDAFGFHDGGQFFTSASGRQYQQEAQDCKCTEGLGELVFHDRVNPGVTF